MTPTFSLIIPTSGNPSRLWKCLQSIRSQNWPPQDFEVLVVANPELNEEFKDRIVKEFPSCRILSSFPIGTCRARNRGLSEAQGQILKFLDDDCKLPHREYLHDLKEAHQTHSPLTLLTGPYIDTPSASILARSYNAVSNFWLWRGRNFNEDMHFLGGNFSMTSVARTDILFFSEDLHQGGEEIDFYLKARRLGLRGRALEKLAVFHHHDYNLREFLRQAWNHGQVRIQATPSAPQAFFARVPGRSLSICLGFGLYLAVVQSSRLAGNLMRRLNFGRQAQNTLEI